MARHDVDIDRCLFPPQRPTPSDTREFVQGEVVCVFDKAKNTHMRGIYEAPAPVFGKIRFHTISGLGTTEPQKIFFGHVGKLTRIEPEDRTKALGEVRNLPPDVEKNVLGFLRGRSRRRRPKRRTRRGGR